MTRADQAGSDDASSLGPMTQQWLQIVAAQGFVPHRVRAQTVLREQLEHLVTAGRAEPFDPAPAERVGAALVEARMAAPRVLGASLTLLAERLPALLGTDDTAHARILLLLAAFADGFADALRSTTLRAAEVLSRSERVAWRDEQARLQNRLQHARLHDTVTDLPNRVSLREQLRMIISTAQPDARMGVCLLRIDDFANLNDALGHTAGEELLHTIGLRLRDVVNDLAHGAPLAAGHPGVGHRYLLAHLGGEHFVITIIGTTGVDEVSKAARLAQRAISDASLPSVDDYQLKLTTTTVGIVEDRLTPSSADDWLRNAHIALAWTRTDRRSLAVFDPARAQADLRRHRLAAAMRAALERGEFLPHFQPWYALADRTIVGVEAVVRWNRRGAAKPLLPEEFIHLAEQTGLIRPLGQSMLRQACRQGAAWHRTGHRVLISVNLSPRQLADPDLLATIEEIVRHTGLPADALQLEITESTAIRDAGDVLDELTDRGVQLAIDDFGTGHANLAALSRLPATTVKLATELVGDLHDTDNAAAAAVVHRTVQLCHDLNVTVTAKGIETPAQYAALRALGCDHGQGPFFCEPQPAGDITHLLNDAGLPG